MEEDFNYDVFLSHSSKDKDAVRAVAERLRADGLRIWFDEWELKPGDSVPKRIDDGLEESRVLLFFMSANAFGSDWAEVERYTYLFRDPSNKERRFIPIRLDEAPIKGFLKQFLHINWLPDHREHSYPKLLEACRPSAQPPAEEEETPALAQDNQTKSTSNSDEQKRTDEKLDEITRLLHGLRGDFSRENLLTDYPLGYVIFEVNYTNSVFPYDKQLLDQYDIDWDVVSLKIIGNRYELRLPDFRHKETPASVIGIRISGVKEVSIYGTGASIGELAMISRILAVREEGLIFVIGFVQVTPPPPLPSERPNFRRSKI